MGNASAAITIGDLANKLDDAHEVIDLLSIEAMAASAYWAGWADLRLRFAKRDRVPDHWKAFGIRRSPISGDPRSAATPGNAILNYLYGVLRSQITISLASVGLDPGMGLLHTDKPSRASLAYDAMEAARPIVDLWFFNWLKDATFAKRDFYEEGNGTVRITRPLNSHLAMTAAL
jgi:CRISPR-associated protein Cas1